MIEILVGIVVIGSMIKIASNDNESAALWGTVTALLAVVSVFTIPMPIVRVFFAGLASFILLIVYKVHRSSRAP